MAICDVSQEAMDETVQIARAAAAEGTRLTTFVADVADPAAMTAFAAHVATEFDTDSINLLFNNAGIGGGGSLVIGDQAEWDRVFGVCWGGVLNGTRSFLPMLQASERGHVSTPAASTACGRVSARPARTPPTAPPSSPCAGSPRR